MARPQLLSIAAAVGLTVAAGLSIAAEHAGSSHAAALGAPLALPPPPSAPYSAGDKGIGSKGTDNEAASAASQVKPDAAPSPAVGSRALTGTEQVGEPAK